MNTLKKVEYTIAQYQLLQQDDRVLVAVSGGADSVCLLHLLIRMAEEKNFKLHVAHLNHGLRVQAGEDASFVQRLCAAWGVPCTVRQENVAAYANIHGISEELAGRRLRYAFFCHLKEQLGFDKIATAHHQNDNAETILMHFLRGGGIGGLSGISYERDHIIRPLLDVSRAEVEQYCADNQLTYVTDETNFEAVYTRNKIRLELIPRIQKEYNPNFIETIVRNGRALAQDALYLNECADAAYLQIVVDGKAEAGRLLAQPEALQRRIIMRMMQEARVEDISSVFVESVLNLLKGTGKHIDLPGGIRASIEYGILCFKKREEKMPGYCYEIPLGRQVYIKEAGIRVLAEQTKGEMQEGWTYFAAGADCRLELRSRRPGDRFAPQGMEGTKKLKNYFIDQKISSSQRERIPILVIDGEIAWVVGFRKDQRHIYQGKGVRVAIKQRDLENSSK